MIYFTMILFRSVNSILILNNTITPMKIFITGRDIYLLKDTMVH